jgi:putative endonuclease
MSAPARPLTPEARALAVQRRARKRHLARTKDRADESSHGGQATRARAKPADEAVRSPTQREGAAQEDKALAHLEAAGLRLLARNVSCRVGELDLVMQEGEVLVFVEVRARRSASHGGAAASVTFAKQQRLTRTAQFFLKTAWRAPMPRCRFDVVAISADRIDWLRDAFTSGNT